MLSLGPGCVDASGTERFIFADIAQSIPRCFFNSGGFEAKAERSSETTNIRNVLSFEPDLCFITTLETFRRLSVLHSVNILGIVLENTI